MSKTKVNLELTLTEFKKLSNYLDRHEEDIALDINDFGQLKELFIVVFGVKAEES